MLKFQFYWYIKNWRKTIMKGLSVLFALLSVLILTIELLDFFGKFENTWLHLFFLGSADRSYITLTVS